MQVKDRLKSETKKKYSIQDAFAFAYQFIKGWITDQTLLMIFKVFPEWKRVLKDKLLMGIVNRCFLMSVIDDQK